MLALIERTRYQQAMRFTKILTVALLSLQCMAFFGMSGKAEAAQYGTSDISAQLFSGEQQQTTRQVYNPLAGPQYPIIQDSYFTDDYGNILMIVNVLGEVNKQGQLVVRENVDFATILALAGGIKQEANLKKVVVARQNPEKKRHSGIHDRHQEILQAWRPFIFYRPQAKRYHHHPRKGDQSYQDCPCHEHYLSLGEHLQHHPE